MADQGLYATVKEFFQNIFDNPAVAEQVAADPQGALAAHGITEYDDEVYRQAVGDAYQEYDLPYGNKDVLAGYTQGAPSPVDYPVQAPAHAAGGQAAGYSAGAEAVQHVQYVTYAAYEEHPQIQQEIVNNDLQFLSVDQSDNREFEVDNSVNLDDVDVDGDLDLEANNASALGDESVAVAGDENALNLGDGDQFIATRGGEIENVATGDGAFAAEEVEGSVNTGSFEGIQAGDDVESAVVGNDNNTANLDFDTGDGGDGGFSGDGGAGGDIESVNLNFGGGDQANFADSEVEVDDGSAFSVGGDADALTAEDSFNREQEIDQEINKEVEIEDSGVADALPSTPVEEAVPAVESDADAEIPVA